MIRLASPAITNDIASVAINALMRKNVATTPLISPTTSPTAMPIRIAGAGGHVLSQLRGGDRGEGVHRADADRSIPPETSTSVPAAAMISVADCWSRMFSRFDLVANDELAIVSVMNRMTNGITIPAVRSLPAPTRRRPAANGRATGRGLRRRCWPRGPRSRGLTRRVGLGERGGEDRRLGHLARRTARQTIRPRRMTRTRCVSPRISSISEEINSTPIP